MDASADEQAIRANERIKTLNELRKEVTKLQKAVGVPRVEPGTNLLKSLMEADNKIIYQRVLDIITIMEEDTE